MTPMCHPVMLTTWKGPQRRSTTQVLPAQLVGVMRQTCISLSQILISQLYRRSRKPSEGLVVKGHGGRIGDLTSRGKVIGMFLASSEATMRPGPQGGPRRRFCPSSLLSMRDMLDVLYMLASSLGP